MNATAASPNRRLRRIGLPLLGSFLVISACANEDSVEVTRREGAVTTSVTQFLMAPTYIYPDDTSGAWQQAVPTQNGNGMIFIVSGTAPPNGFAQPPTAYDQNFADAVHALQATGASVLGYITWKEALGRSANDIKLDMNAWYNPSLQLGLRGVFIDDAERSDESILADIEGLGNYGQELFSGNCMGPCPGRVVFNWGGVGSEMEKYVDCTLLRANDTLYARNAFNWVTYEGTEDNYLWATNWFDGAHNWVHNYFAWRFVNLVFGDWYNGECVTGDCGPNLLQASGTANAAFLYMTDHWGPTSCTSDSQCPGGTCDLTSNTCAENTWGRIASNPLWADEQAAIPWHTNTFQGTGQSNEIYAHSIGECPAPTVFTYP